MLRFSTRFVLALALAVACGAPVPPSDETSETTQAADSSTGAVDSGSVSATSTTGRPPATSGTTLESTTTSDGSSEDTGMVFLMEPDGGCSSYAGEHQLRCSQCDVVAQDCLIDGEKCVPWANDGGDAWNATRCAPVAEDPAGVGEPCVAEGSPTSGLDDCALGLLCFAVDPRTLQGTCAALCNGDEPDACGDDAVCVDYDYFAPHVCLPRCDPTDPTACPADEGCRPIGSDALCVPTVTLPEGLDCSVDGQHCAIEEACWPADELASCGQAECCTPWCDLSAPDPDLPCSAVPGEVCRPFSATPPAGHEHVGVCGLPP